MNLPHFNSLPHLNTPLSRVLRGTAMPEDIVFARRELSDGLRTLHRLPVGPVQIDGLQRMLHGSQTAEDLVNGTNALKFIQSPQCRFHEDHDDLGL